MVRLYSSMTILFLVLVCLSVAYGGNVHRCVHASRKLAKSGNGTTDGSCMMCDPTTPVCAVGCQGLVDELFKDCNGVCLPDGYFYDPLWTYKGCWKDHREEVLVGVNRCGCDSAFSIMQSGGSLSVVLAATVLVVLAQALL